MDSVDPNKYIPLWKMYQVDTTGDKYFKILGHPITYNLITKKLNDDMENVSG